MLEAVTVCTTGDLLPKPILERAATCGGGGGGGGKSWHGGASASSTIGIASRPTSDGCDPTPGRAHSAPEASTYFGAPATSCLASSVAAPDAAPDVPSPLLVAAPTCSSLLVRSLTDMGNPKQARYISRDACHARDAQYTCYGHACSNYGLTSAMAMPTIIWPC